MLREYRTNKTPKLIEHSFNKGRWFAVFAVVRLGIDPGGRLSNPSSTHFAEYHVHDESFAVKK
uniref:hypothetical protein n=1 Tax=Serratia nevei TaxID=2703794 RepID=UPI003F7CE4AB